MRIEAHDKFGRPIKQEITRLVVYDDFDNPISVSLKYSQGLCYTGTVNCPEFNNILKMLGIDKTVIVTTLDTEKLNERQLKPII